MKVNPLQKEIREPVNQEGYTEVGILAGKENELLDALLKRESGVRP